MYVLQPRSTNLSLHLVSHCMRRHRFRETCPHTRLSNVSSSWLREPINYQSWVCRHIARKLQDETFSPTPSARTNWPHQPRTQQHTHAPGPPHKQTMFFLGPCACFSHGVLEIMPSMQSNLRHELNMAYTTRVSLHNASPRCSRKLAWCFHQKHEPYVSGQPSCHVTADGKPVLKYLSASFFPVIVLWHCSLRRHLEKAGPYFDDLSTSCPLGNIFSPYLFQILSILSEKVLAQQLFGVWKSESDRNVLQDSRARCQVPEQMSHQVRHKRLPSDLWSDECSMMSQVSKHGCRDLCLLHLQRPDGFAHTWKAMHCRCRRPVWNDDCGDDGVYGLLMVWKSCLCTGKEASRLLDWETIQIALEVFLQWSPLLRLVV